MSIMSLLFAFVPAIIARRSEPDSEIEALRAQLAQARRELDAARAQLDASALQRVACQACVSRHWALNQQAHMQVLAEQYGQFNEAWCLPAQRNFGG